MKRPVSIRDKFASKRKQKRVSNTWRPVIAELFICAALLSAKFYRCRAFWAKFHFRLPFGVKFTTTMSFGKILPSLGFP
ncbi:hypothetical protein [uncultured Campylobacter sp.]|uniref:hypothetical protein n=1 Tax=uncultured Campylobacter sp. TaxID=218934 RepID=UPI00263395A2|nr:hypothetical protein [uncultured Campylobacter sp.]